MDCSRVETDFIFIFYLIFRSYLSVFTFVLHHAINTVCPGYSLNCALIKLAGLGSCYCYSLVFVSIVIIIPNAVN